jgi:hypothetical protein
MSIANVSHPASPPRSRSASTLPALLVLALLTGSAAVAQAGHLPQVGRDFAAEKGPIAVEVKVSGRATPLYLPSDRPDRWYLEARKGQKYEIRVRNTTGERVGFVLAVDGLNAIDGRLSQNAASEPMYVLEPHADATIKGWRRSMDQVARFVFVDEPRSYAERTGQGNGDLGWIRVTAFHEVWTGQRTWGSIRAPYRDGDDSRARAEEKQSPPPSAAPAPEARRQQANGQDIQGESSREPVADANPGTGWGPNQRDRVRTVDFTPRSHAAAQVILRYEYKPALVAMGILPWRPAADRTWEREHGLYGFAQPPRDGR